MAIRVVARIRPRQQEELDKDVIVSTASNSDDSLHPTEVKIPNPRNERENFTCKLWFRSLFARLRLLFEPQDTPKTARTTQIISWIVC